jgi:hypothetical protein
MTGSIVSRGTHLQLHVDAVQPSLVLQSDGMKATDFAKAMAGVKRD